MSRVEENTSSPRARVQEPTPRSTAAPGRRGFIGGLLAGAASLLAVARGGRPGPRPEAAPSPTARPLDPWVPRREVVISPDALTESGDELAG